MVSVAVLCKDVRARTIADLVGSTARCVRIRKKRLRGRPPEPAFYVLDGSDWLPAPKGVPARFDLVFLHPSDCGPWGQPLLGEAKLVVQFNAGGYESKTTANLAVDERLRRCRGASPPLPLDVAVLDAFPHDLARCPVSRWDMDGFLALAAGTSVDLPQCCLPGRAEEVLRPLWALDILLQGWLARDPSIPMSDAASPWSGLEAWDEAQPLLDDPNSPVPEPFTERADHTLQRALAGADRPPFLPPYVFSSDSRRASRLLAQSLGEPQGKRPAGGALRLCWDAATGRTQAQEADLEGLALGELERIVERAHEEFVQTWSVLVGENGNPG